MVKKVLVMVLALVLLAMPLASYASGQDDANRVMKVYGKYELGLGEGPSPDSDRVQADIEGKVGFKTDFIPIAGDAYNEKMNLVLASGEAFDWMGNISKGWGTLSADGHIMPLNDLIDQYGANIVEKMGNGFKATSDAQGTIWGIPWFIGNHWGNVPTIREDWAAAAGFPNLPQTIEEFEQYMEYVLTHDLNGNGIQDEIPLLPNTPDFLIGHFRGLIMGQEFLSDRYLDEDGNVQPACAHPTYVDFLTVLRDWYAKGYIYQEYFVIKPEQAADLVGADRAGTYCAWYSSVISPFTAVREQDMSKNYAVLPALQSAFPGVVSAHNNGTPYQDGVYIPATSENPDLTIKYINWLLEDPSNYLEALIGFEGEHWDWISKDELVYKQEVGAHEQYYRLMCPSVNFSWYDRPFSSEPSETIRSQMYFQFERQALAMQDRYAFSFDLYAPYTTVGTEMENINTDGPTLLNESRLKYIVGEISKEQMEAAIAQYMQIYGDAYSRVYTAQYKAFKGIE